MDELEYLRQLVREYMGIQRTNLQACSDIEFQLIRARESELEEELLELVEDEKYE